MWPYQHSRGGLESHQGLYGEACALRTGTSRRMEKRATWKRSWIHTGLPRADWEWRTLGWRGGDLAPSMGLTASSPLSLDMCSTHPTYHPPPGPPRSLDRQIPSLYPCSLHFQTLVSPGFYGDLELTTVKQPLFPPYSVPQNSLR